MPPSLFADNLEVSGDAGTVLICVDRAVTSGWTELGFHAALNDIQVLQGALRLAIRYCDEPSTTRRLAFGLREDGILATALRVT